MVLLKFDLRLEVVFGLLVEGLLRIGDLKRLNEESLCFGSAFVPTHSRMSCRFRANSAALTKSCAFANLRAFFLLFVALSF